MQWLPCIAQMDIDGFFLVNEKYTIQAGDTTPEIDTICLGEPFSIAFHIGGAQKVNSVSFIVNGQTYIGLKATNLTIHDTGSYSFDGEADVIDKLGNQRFSSWGFLSLVVIHCPPTTQINSQDKICQNECLQFTNTSTNYPTTYEWLFAGGSPAFSSDSLPPLICYSDTGTFPITLIVSNPAEADTAIKYITVTSAPRTVQVQKSFSIKEGELVLLQACAEGDTYNWQPFGSADSSIEVQPEETQQYTCEVSTFNNCSVQCDYTVFVQNGLLLPTAFSPNGDGLNDEFRILNTNIKLLAFNIYNRWGEMVFSSNNQRNGWDGTFKNEAQDIGVYTWSVDYIVTGSGKQKLAKGNVTLVR
jgi:gliding motility-associated-like protein